MKYTVILCMGKTVVYAKAHIITWLKQQAYSQCIKLRKPMRRPSETVCKAKANKEALVTPSVLESTKPQTKK